MTEHHPAQTCTSYLALDEVPAAQRPPSAEHDELLFIVVHQVYEPWFQQMLHELGGLRGHLAASGSQSAQFPGAVPGRRDRRAFAHYRQGGARIEAAMAEPSVFDAFVACLAVPGYEVLPEVRDRDVSLPWEPSPALQGVLLKVYAGAATVAGHLAGLDEGVQEWRYRHATTVERTISVKAVADGSARAWHLRSTLLAAVSPNLCTVRSRL